MIGGYWLFITVLLFIVSLILRWVPLLLVSLLFFLTGGVARLWERYCLDRVEYRHKLSASRVFFGDEVELEVEVSNRKPLPLPWVQIDDEIPKEVTLLKGKTSLSPNANRVVLSNFLSLNWYHKVQRRYPIRCLQRGYFAFGPARIRSGDLFGFFSRAKEVEAVDYLMVYPKILPLEKLGIPSKQPMGEVRIRKHIFQDPALTLGVRDYHSGDSLKQIHWKTTARLGQLQTRVFEPTTTVDMGIFLDVRTTKSLFEGSVPRLLELTIIVAASFANHAIAEGYQVGLYVNQNRWFSGKPIRIPPSRHPDQLLRILEVLAPIHPFGTKPIAELVVNENPNLPWGSTMVVITAVPTDALLSSLIKIKRAGRRVVLVLVGGAEPSITKDGLTMYHIRDDVIWRELEMISGALY